MTKRSLLIGASVLLALISVSLLFRASSNAALSSRSNAFVGSWETTQLKEGVVFSKGGHAEFFRAGHICPTIWATYTARDRTVIATDRYHHERQRVMTLDANGLLHDRSGKNIYRRVHAITFPKDRGHRIRC